MNRSTVSWRPPDHFRIVPLNPTLQPRVSELRAALDNERQIVPDTKREDFFSLVTNGAWFYVHIHGAVVYLVGHQRLDSRTANEACGEAESSTQEIKGLPQNLWVKPSSIAA